MIHRSDIFLFLELILLVGVVMAGMRTSWGKKLGRFVPTPFWIYFLPIVLSTLEFFPHESPVYEMISVHVLPMALILLLLGTPLTSLFRMSVQATWAIGLASLTMVAASLIAYVFFQRFLPVGSEKVVGALLGTWVGGSANMLALKEILSIPSELMTPLIIVDTFLSYGWMALIVFAANWQGRFDRWVGADSSVVVLRETDDIMGPYLTPRRRRIQMGMIIITLLIAFCIGEIMVWGGEKINVHWSLLNPRGWTILLTSVVAIGLAMTRLRHLEKWGASRWGGYWLYLVLATIGVKTTLQAVKTAPIFLLFGLTILILHGIFLLGLGRMKKIPLFFLSTASQAAVGGPVSAPIVAEVYQPGTAHIGVLMAIFGALIGTYIGLLGSWICHYIKTALS